MSNDEGVRIQYECISKVVVHCVEDWEETILVLPLVGRPGLVSVMMGNDIVTLDSGRARALGGALVSMAEQAECDI